MNKRPKIELKLARIDKVLEILGWVAVFAIWVLALTSYSNLPDTIPIHYNAMGQADNYGNKGIIFVFPITGTLLFVIFTILNKFPHTFKYPTEITPENALQQYTIGTRFVRVLKLIVVVILGLVLYYTIIYYTGLAEKLGMWLLPIIIVLIIVPVIYFSIKLSKSKS